MGTTHLKIATGVLRPRKRPVETAECMSNLGTRISHTILIYENYFIRNPSLVTSHLPVYLRKRPCAVNFVCVCVRARAR
jgi:hypothetical protein